PPPMRREQEPFGFAIEDGTRADDGRGVRIASIDLRGNAYRAGLREGDMILELDGKPVRDKGAYRKVISGLGNAPVARLYVRRGGKSLFFGVRRDPQRETAGR